MAAHSSIAAFRGAFAQAHTIVEAGDRGDSDAALWRSQAEEELVPSS